MREISACTKNMNLLKQYIPPNGESLFTEDEARLRSFLEMYEDDILRTDLSRVSNSIASLSEDDTRWLKEVRQTMGVCSLLESMTEAVRSNQEFLTRVSKSARFSGPVSGSNTENLSSRIRALPWAVAREWGSEKNLDPEREAVYSSMISAIKKNLICGKILVPGTSFSRLQYEVASLGFETTGVEFDMLRLMVTDFIFSGNATRLTPYVLETCNRFQAKDNVREVVVPDIQVKDDVLRRMTIVGGEFTESASIMDDNEFDGIATSFFLDTTSDVGSYVSIFSRVLKPGGIWVNCGPLQYHYPTERGFGSPVRGPSLEELKSIIEQSGFEFLEQRFLETEYMGNALSMMSTKIKCFFFLARLKD